MRLELLRKTAGHAHAWVRDDVPGFRMYICLFCGYTFGLAKNGKK